MRVSKEAEKQEALAAQFPSIERLIETEDFDGINKSFTASYEALEKISKGSGGLGRSREARKAMRAIERVMDLLRDLLRLKHQTVEGGNTSEEATTRGVWGGRPRSGAPLEPEHRAMPVRGRIGVKTPQGKK